VLSNIRIVTKVTPLEDYGCGFGMMDKGSHSCTDLGGDAIVAIKHPHCHKVTPLEDYECGFGMMDKGSHRCTDFRWECNQCYQTSALSQSESFGGLRMRFWHDGQG